MLLLLVLFSCRQEVEGGIAEEVGRTPEITDFPIAVPPINPAAHGIVLTAPAGLPYRQAKQQMANLRESFQQEVHPVEEKSARFTAALLNTIIPYWYNTSWSFEGHTAQPGKGYVACGYFVSTTLRDVGVNLNRYRLAQQAPAVEARTLALGGPVIEIAEPTTAANITAIRDTLPPGIHFIGFDTGHVGYVLKIDDLLFLIHSNYRTGFVMMEDIRQSEVFTYYNRYLLVPLSTSSLLLEKWINGEEVLVLKE